MREEKYASILVDAHNQTELGNSSGTLIPKKSDHLECSIQTLPTLIKQDLATLFPSKKFDGGPLTAIILSHRTTEGLEQWSEMAVTEREVLAESYLGPHGEDALVETDERMKHFGFELDDARCCKVLRHPRWKHYVFAGLIFTDAPKDHPVLSHF
ncbi:hypothetical protein FBUS_09217 [Fasciolopsis buskii]|uniref:Uncharacterized protein n=1 Tax=Fasciolopsis buskii TaxID=27845 RepID=A0A8E0S3K3_9TREM|nr:hypothetical protein FBUS_09217 [Fasciolopsis buski]